MGARCSLQAPVSFCLPSPFRLSGLQDWGFSARVCGRIQEPMNLEMWGLITVEQSVSMGSRMATRRYPTALCFRCT